MSNKLIKKVTCCLCDKEVKYTDECRELWGKWVCPECSEKVAKFVNEKINEEIDKKGEGEKENE